MSKVAKILSPITGLLSKPKVPALPEPAVPAAPAPTRREDTGASVVVGADAVRNQRVSGSTKKKSSKDVLGNLGYGSGLNI